VSGQRHPEDAALDRLILELRAEPKPELDWDRVEARLMQEAKAAAPSPSSRLASRLRWPALALAAAAAVFVVTRHPQGPLPTVGPRPVAQVATGPLNGDQLALGTRLTAGNQNLIVEHAGRARWTLEPHSTAFVSDLGQFLTVQLESGALSAAVVPNTKPETFAVEAGGTRVAVHGTAFRVERSGERLLVQVSEGTVAVEPAQTHSAPAFLLRRDSRGSFGLDGHTGSVEGNASAVVGATALRSRREIAPLPRAARPAKASTAAATPAPSPAARAAERPELAPPQQPSISDIENGVSSAVSVLNGCFRESHASGILVSASTGMTLSVAGDGTIQSVTFSPPLAPVVEDCAVLGLRNLTFARSIDGATFTRIIELTR
jgi:hypothetical protein